MTGIACPQCANLCKETDRFCPACGFPVFELARKSEEDSLIGTTLPGGYVVQELVGVGGMGRVYRAEQTALGRSVAVKLIHPHLIGDESMSARFIREARASSRLNHPNSVAVIDFGMNGVQPYLVMEFLRGRDLGKVMTEDGPLPFRRIVDILCQVLAGLAEAHELWIIHRDLKPENIVLEPMRLGGDFVKVVDFGLAKMRAEVSGNVTGTGVVCGTPDYMSPEQGRGDNVDARSDLYSCGVILYRLLTGRLPFESDVPVQVVLMHMSKAPPSPAEVAPDRHIPDALVEITMKALEKAPARRFQSANELSSALQAALTMVEAPSGQRTAPAADHVPCPACNARIPRGRKFCGECGGRAPEPAVQRAATVAAPIEPPPPSARLPLPFAGRERELAWLEGCRIGVNGAIACARIVGDHGVGKSRLLAEFLDSAADEGDVIVRIGPDPWRAEVGYYALRNAIAGLALLPDDGGNAAEWAGASPEARSGLQEIFRQPKKPSGARRLAVSPEGFRFGAAKALRWALGRALESAQRKRVILAIEDLDRVDGASRNALRDATEPVVGSLLFVATHVPGFDPEWRGGSTLLRGLPMSVVGSLVRGAAPERGRAPGAEGRLVSPLYIDQLVRFSLERGSDPPSRVGDLVATRIERLAPDARRTLQVLAVMGDSADVRALRQLLPEVEDFDSQLGKLIAAGLVADQTRAGSPHRAIGTTHPLVRDVTLASIPAWVRRDLHASLASGEAGPADALPLEVQALHAYHAQDSFEALMLLEQVADLAAARADSDGCIRALGRGLDLARREVFRREIDDPAGAVLIFSQKLSDAFSRIGDVEGAQRVMRQAVDLSAPGSSNRPSPRAVDSSS